MAQLLQILYTVAPLLLVGIMTAAILGGVWLLIQVKRQNAQRDFTVADRLFVKRNAARMRKIQLH